jgi:hypothetical protein
LDGHSVVDMALARVIVGDGQGNGTVGIAHQQDLAGSSSCRLRSGQERKSQGEASQYPRMEARSIHRAHWQSRIENCQTQIL